MRKSIFYFLLLILISACTTQDETALNEGDYLIFGHFYGFCVGESCVEIFKLTNDKLYEDSNDNYAMEPFNFEELGHDKFEQAKDLINYFPEKLLTEKESIILNTFTPARFTFSTKKIFLFLNWHTKKNKKRIHSGVFF